MRVSLSARLQLVLLLRAGQATGVCASTALPAAVTYRSSSHPRCPGTCASAALPAAVSLGSGMVAGAIGVGVAYPLDTIKTKMQTYRGRDGVDGVGALGPIGTVKEVLRSEGPAGFYGGVSSTMAGQALIKGALFFTHRVATVRLSRGRVAPLPVPALALAAAVAGAVASLVCTPVERVKVVMQSSAAGAFASPADCAAQLVRADGLSGLLTRGLGDTLLREVPTYTLYFLAYAFACSWLVAAAPSFPSPLVPLVGGAVAGAASWVPVYPVDVVKTNLQASVGAGRSESFLGCARRLYAAGGVGVFWEGLRPKVARAVVNHAVTFFTLELLTGWFAARLCCRG